MWRRIRRMIGDGLEGEADEVFSSYSFPTLLTLLLLAAGSCCVLTAVLLPRPVSYAAPSHSPHHYCCHLPLYPTEAATTISVPIVPSIGELILIHPSPGSFGLAH